MPETSPPARPTEDGTSAGPAARPLPVGPCLRWLAVVAGALTVLGPLVNVVDGLLADRDGPARGLLAVVARVLDVDAEASLPTTFSVLLWAGLTAVLVVLAVLRRLSGQSWGAHLALAAVAGLLTLDEGSSLHEELARITGQFVDGGSVPTFEWLLPGVVVVLAVGAVLLRLAREVAPSLRRRLVVAGVVFLAGAVGFEALSGFFYTVTPVPDLPQDLRGPQTPVYRVLNGLEEGLEMAGALLALRAGLLALSLRSSPGLLTAEAAAARP